jgi:hypothetical protein
VLACVCPRRSCNESLDVTLLDVVRLEKLCEANATLVEESETDDGLDNTNTLPTERSLEPKLLRVERNLLHRCNGPDGLALDAVRLHNHLQPECGWVGGWV